MDNEFSKLIRSTFDAVADGYDTPALRFFVNSAEHLVTKLALRGDEQVLDVACGTGNTALAIARRLPRGRVTAVDFSPAMLAQARPKAKAAGLANLEFIESDMQALSWQATFDAAVCAFGIFFVEDMDAQLARIAATVKPGGRVMITNFTADYMEPLRSLMVNRIASFGVKAPPPTWLRIANEDGCRAFFETAGLREVEVERKNLGYFLADPQAWWDVMWNAGFRRLLGQLSTEELARFKQEHLAEIEGLRTKDGIRMDVGVLFTSGTR